MVYLLLLLVLIVVLAFAYVIRSGSDAEEVAIEATEPGLTVAPDNSTQKSGRISEWSFRDLLIEELQSRDPSLVIQLDDMSLELFTDPDENAPVEVNLGNIYRTYWNEPERRDEIIFRFADITMEAVATARGVASEISEAQIAAVLRHVNYLDEIDTEAVIWKPFLGDLIVLMVFYYPDFLAGARKDDLVKLSLTPEQAWGLALENLKTRFDDRYVSAENSGSKVFSGESGLATGQLWRMFQSGTGPNFAAMVINKDDYMYADTEDDAAMQILAGYGAELIAIDDTLSENLVSRIDGYAFASRLEGQAWLPIENKD